jgi:phosphoribosylformylglycinamidine synthase
MGQFVGAIKGIGAACTALGMPIVSGNVSLYNETDGQAILPTPTIGAVGLIETADGLIGTAPAEGDWALLLGETSGHLGQSALLAEAFGREDGDAPHVDLDAETRNGRFILDNRQWIRAATDLSDGGLALAAFEMALAGGTGVTLDTADIAQLFGEDQARYLVACPFDWAESLMVLAGQAGVPVALVGKFGGEDVRFGDSVTRLDVLRDIHASAFSSWMG